MENSNSKILPLSVEKKLQEVLREKLLARPEDCAVRELLSLSEDKAMYILERIRCTMNIRSLTAFIRYMVKNCQFEPASGSTCSNQRSYYSPISHSPTINEKVMKYPSPVKPVDSVYSKPSFSTSDTSGHTGLSHQLQALGELEFRKAFLILAYAGKKSLEDVVVSADMIREWKNLPMIDFEFKVWNEIGKKCADDVQRVTHLLDWESGKTHLYHCHVHTDGGYTFKGPYFSRLTTHLHRVIGDDNILLVKFDEKMAINENQSSHHNPVFNKIRDEGISVALRRYRFFVFKDGGKEEKKKDTTSSPVKCYFVRMESDALFDKKSSYIFSDLKIHEARSKFMHIHTASSLAKYNARFSLILSKTSKLDMDFSDVNVEIIDDVFCKDENGHIVHSRDGDAQIHTDGTGFISEDLALTCPLNIIKGKYLDNENRKKFLHFSEDNDYMISYKPSSRATEPPLLIQCRLFHNGSASKGTLLINKMLPPKTIQIRPSMIKIETDRKFSNIKPQNSLEVVQTSNRPRKSYLSRYLIALLSYGGVPNTYFMDILAKALEEAQGLFTNTRLALKVSLQHGEIDDFTVTRMILAGIPLSEPFTQHQLTIYANDEKRLLRDGKLPITDCFYLMGTSDPTNTLERDQVCIVLDSGQVSGRVLVFKHPGLHFGDIHVVSAVYVSALESVIGNAKYGIFFSTKGPRSLADEMANSDFDGDMYWVSRNPQLLEYFKPSKPWIPSYFPKDSLVEKPSEFTPRELEHKLFKLFIDTRFKPSSSIGVAAESWLAMMDQLLTVPDDSPEKRKLLKKKILHLIDIYYLALDAPKTGMKVEIPAKLRVKKYPHFMERANHYRSTSILGKIYDAVKAFQDNASTSQDVVLSMLPCFDRQVSKQCLDMWKVHYKNYRTEMSKALKEEKEIREKLADDIIKKYKKILYGAPEFEENEKDMCRIFEEALAVYQVTYAYAKVKGSPSLCGFAWKIGAPALCKFHSLKLTESSLVCSPSVLKEIFN